MWTNISKPTGTPYTKVQVFPTYDESSVAYDSSVDFYDGFNQAMYTLVSKPAGSADFRAGMTMGLLIPLTNARQQTIGQPWISINKPT